MCIRDSKEEQQEEALRLLLDLLHVVGDLYRRVCDRRISRADWAEVRVQLRNVQAEAVSLLAHPSLSLDVKEDAEAALEALEMQFGEVWGEM